MQYRKKTAMGVLTCVALTLTALAGLQTSGVSSAAPREGAEAPKMEDFPLESAWTGGGSLTEKLDKILYKSGVQKLLGKANRQATSGRRCGRSVFPDSELPTSRFCFERSDRRSREWIPQGITSTSDAKHSQYWGQTQAMLFSWYDTLNPGRGDQEDPTDSKPPCSDRDFKKYGDSCSEKGVRVTFLDRQTKKYRHVLLVWPHMNSKDHVSYDAIRSNDSKLHTGIHAGGLAWYGNYLYVADTANGVRMFDMRKIIDLDKDGKPSTDDKTQKKGLKTNVSNKKLVGRHNNKFYGYGYRYVMPQVDGWESVVGNAKSGCKHHGPLRFSYLSVDRSGEDTLVAGEYCKASKNPKKYGRVVKYPLDHTNGDLEETCDQHKCDVGAVKAYRLSEPNIQGAMTNDGTWYLSRSKGCDKSGQMVKAKVPGKEDAEVLKKPYKRDKYAVSPEDLTYWRGSKEIYTITENLQKGDTAEKGCKGIGGKVLFGVRK